ncbi:MFS transporter [Tautonia sociabilis]|uniref:MFS transporter n=1 Tax=Tautonia sociabilis TaxID=2080755 RepID=A0A432MEL7_9BACT|nr:MFS transporter [Tautonia sociabilis]RUL83959.1 MFS transporter [Tautonia sociabilis]
MLDEGRDARPDVEDVGPKPERGDNRPTRVRFLVLFSACSLAVVTYIHRVGFATASTPMREEFGLDQRQLGLLMAAFMVAYGLAEVPWGMVGDRKGVRNSLAVIILGGSLATAALAAVAWIPGTIAGAFAILFALRFLFGAFQAGTFPSITRMLADWMPTTERGGAQGLLWMSSRIGGTVAPLLLVPLFGMFGSWETPLVLVAGLGAVWCVLFWPWFRNRPEEKASVNQAELERIAAGRREQPTGHGAVPWGSMATSGSVWALCLMYGALGYSGNFFITLLPDYLSTHRGFSPGTIQWMTSLPFAVGVGSCLLGGTLSDLIIRVSGSRRWGRRVVGAVGMAIAGVAILATLRVEGVWALGGLLCLTYFGNDLAMGPAWAAAADKGERHAGTLGGLMNMTASLTAALAAVVTGHLLESNDVTLPFYLFAASYVFGALCWLRVDVTHTIAGRAEAPGEDEGDGDGDAEAL